MQRLAVHIAIQLSQRVLESVVERLTVCIHHTEPAQDADSHSFTDTEPAPDAKSDADADPQPDRDSEHHRHEFANSEQHAVVCRLKDDDTLRSAVANAK